MLVFFSIFKLIVFSMLNENFFITLMKSEEVKKIGDCYCLVLLDAHKSKTNSFQIFNRLKMKDAHNAFLVTIAQFN